MINPERARLAAAQRRLIEMAATRELSDEELDRAAILLDSLASELEGAPLRAPRTPQLPELDDLAAFFNDDPVSGQENPLAPPVAITIEDRTAVGRVTFNRSYEGAPGFVHGGAIAAVFDQMLGMANIASGHPGMTGTLTVRYVQPTPIDTELRFEASSGEREGRKSFVSGSCFAGDTLTAEAEGTFIMLRLRQAAQMFLGRAAP